MICGDGGLKGLAKRIKVELHADLLGVSSAETAPAAGDRRDYISAPSPGR